MTRSPLVAPAFLALALLAGCAKPVPWAAERPEQVRAAVAQGKALLVDAREAKEWAAGHLAGALSLPAEKLESSGVKLSPAYFGRPVYVYAASGRQAQEVARLLEKRRVDVRPLEAPYTELAASLGPAPAPPPNVPTGEGR